MLYLQAYLTNFPKLFFWLKEEEGGFCGWKFQVHRNFGFAIATSKRFQHPENVKFQIFHLPIPSRNPISPEVFNEFFKSFLWLKEEEGGYFGWKFQLHRYFGFAIGTLPLFQHPENVKFQFFHLPIPSRNAISPQVFNDFFKSLIWLKEEDGGYFGWKFQVRRYFRFAVATLQLFEYPENVNISILPFTLSQQICYISRSILRIF